jgi:hypothetical protein
MTLRGVLGKTIHPTSNSNPPPTSIPTSAPANGDSAPPYQYQQRHGSAESYRSTDTVRGPGIAVMDAAAEPGSQFGKLKSGKRIG